MKINQLCSFGGLLIVLLSGCSTSTPIPQADHEEIVRRNHAVESELDSRFQTQLQLKKDPEVQEFLRNQAQKLVDSTKGLQGPPARVELIRNTRSDRWLGYGLPGNRVYLPLGLLKQLDYENEVAATLALQLGHILKKQVIENIVKKLTSDELPHVKMEHPSLDHLTVAQSHELIHRLTFFGADGIFNYSEENEMGALKSAVEILHNAGYDARGLLTLFERFQNNLSQSPYEMGTLEKLIEQTRLEIALYAPVRNPIVRSHRFMTIFKRIQRL